MICKNCGAIIKQNEEYCRKCGSIVLILNNHENKDLRYICIENNLRGKLKNIVNRLLGTEKKEHNVNKINSKKTKEINFGDIGKNISQYMNENRDSKDSMYLIMEAFNKLNQKK